MGNRGRNLGPPRNPVLSPEILSSQVGVSNNVTMETIMKRKEKFLLYFERGAISVVLALLAATTGWAAERQILHGHVPDAVGRLVPKGFLESSKRLNLAIGLPLRNADALDKFLRDVQDPTSPSFGHYLTPEQFTEQFGPTEQDYRALIEWAKTNGLTIVQTHPNRLILDVEGTVWDIETAFHVTMRTFDHPAEARTFYAPDVEPSVSLLVPISEISGLDNYSLPHPNVHPSPAARLPNATTNSGQGPYGTYAGSDFRAAYIPSTQLTGTGQAVGLLEFDGYWANDIATYQTQFGLPNIPLQIVQVDGGITAGRTRTGSLEVSLDIEMAMAMAPGLAKIYVYEAPIGSPWVDILNRMATDNNAKQLSCSWTGGGPNGTAEAIFRQMAAQGQSFFTASGDSDAYTGTIPFPADSPNITVVGGTTLTTTGPGGSYVSETAWNWGSGVGSSGGNSTHYAKPWYQQGMNMAANLGSTTMRTIPDVAMTADNIWVTYYNGQSGSVGGTSCAAPLWAAFTALVNQDAAAVGRPWAGFLNPTIYGFTTKSSQFHDVTSGNNFTSASPSKFPAVAGYDLCTGWGSPRNPGLLNAWLLNATRPGDILVSDIANNVIYRFTPDGTGEIFAAGLAKPEGLAFDTEGNLFEGDRSSNTIYKFAPDGTRSIFATKISSSYGPVGLAFDIAGNLFVSDGSYIYKFAPDGTRSTFATGSFSSGLAVDRAGNLFATDARGNAIYKFAPNGMRTTFAAGLHYPDGLAFDSAGYLFEADADSGRILKFATDGTSSTFARGLNQPDGLAFDNGGHLFANAYGSGTVYKFAPDGTSTIFATGVGNPTLVTIRPSTP